MATAAPVKSPVTAYALDVTEGRVLAGNLVRLACERHLKDLQTAGDRDRYFDEDEAARVIQFFSLLRQSKGRWAGEPLTLQPWQAFVVGSVFGWKAQATGLRRFRRAYVSVPRKNGKSTLASGVALWLLDFDGEPGAEIYSAALKRDQARIVWGEAERMVKQTPSLARRIRCVPSRANMHVMETGSKFEAVSKDNDSLQGLNVHGYIVDELHVHPNRDVVDVLETATGAREQPLGFYITTAGLIGESIYSEVDDYAVRVLEGRVEDDEFFGLIGTLDPEDDWTDPAVYCKANLSLGVTVQFEDLVQERDRAMETPGRQNAFRRLRLNQRTEQESRWISMEKYDACNVPVDVAAFRGQPCYAGLDLSSTIDVTACVYTFPDGDGGYDVHARFWMPEAGIYERSRRDGVPYDQWAKDGWIELTPGNLVDYDAVRERIREDAETFAVREIAYDRWNATQIVTQLTGDGALMVPFGQGYASMSAPAKEFERLLLAGKFRFGGNPVLRWMFGNVTVQTDPAGNIKPVKPDRRKSALRIDGVVALVMALGRAIVHDAKTDWSYGAV